MSKKLSEVIYIFYVKKCGKSSLNARCLKRYYSTEMRKTKWKSAIGLEVHAQIATVSKLFSGASTKFAETVNSAVSLFDCATPGTMPVLNKKCIEAAVSTALALDCSLNEVSIFERKHYFYPDQPAGFQITQQKHPLAVNGQLQFYIFHPNTHKCPYKKCTKLKQIQIEQDSGKSLHDAHIKKHLIDFNRAGVPLMELVFEPDLIDGEEAAAAVKELAHVLKILGTCSGKFEEGALRVDVNVSVSNDNTNLGIRTEIKNIGSVRAVAAAVTYEIKRQISILENGGKIVNETRAWNAESKKTIVLREKEEKQDYRFMPETNLLPLRIYNDKNSEGNKYNLVDVCSLKKQLPALPEEIRYKLKETYNLSERNVIIISSELMLLKLFKRIMMQKKNHDSQKVANFIIHEVLTFLYKNDLQLEFGIDNAEYIGELIEMLYSNQINIMISRKILDKLSTELNKMPKEIVEENNWFLINDTQRLEAICLKVIEKNPKKVRQYKSGKKKVFPELVNYVAIATDNCANMIISTEIMKRLLD